MCASSHKTLDFTLGTPLDMSSDRGSQFTSTLWNEIAHQLGVKLYHTTAYHPQSNGLVERFHRTLKAALKARLQGPSWTDELPWVLLGLRTVPKDGISSSAAELVYGTPLTVPGQFIDPSSKSQPTIRSALLLRNFPPFPYHTTAYRHQRPCRNLSVTHSSFSSVKMATADLSNVLTKDPIVSWRQVKKHSA